MLFNHLSAHLFVWLVIRAGHGRTPFHVKLARTHEAPFGNEMYMVVREVRDRILGRVNALEEKITEMIGHMARSHQQLARIIEAKKDVTLVMGSLISAIPDDHEASNHYEDLLQNSKVIAKSLTSYLNSLADLEEALAGNLGNVMKELDIQEDE